MKLLLVDDHETLRTALRELVSTDPAFEVVAEGSNGAEAVDLVDEMRPDVVLMDISMPVMGGVEATLSIRERHPDVRIVALSSFQDAGSVSAMVGAGASGYLLKTAPPAEILSSLHSVVEGRPVLSPEILQAVLDDLGDLYREQRARAEALAEVDRMKRSFVSLISDELRTPLTSITGYVSTLRRGWDRLDDDMRLEFLDGIEANTARLGRRLEQILTVSGITSREGNVMAFNLDSVAREARDRLGDRMSERSCEVDLQPVTVVGDRAGAMTVAVTLLENALDHADGDVTLRVCERDDGMAALIVADRGEGMPPEVVAGLAGEPFAQGDDTHTREVAGLGLSLYIARRLLETGGGRLEVSSEPGSGSTFTALLPRAPDVSLG